MQTIKTNKNRTQITHGKCGAAGITNGLYQQNGSKYSLDLLQFTGRC